MVDLSLLEREEVCAAAFRRLDADGSGGLSPEEVAAALGQVCGSAPPVATALPQRRGAPTPAANGAQGCPHSPPHPPRTARLPRRASWDGRRRRR